RSCPRSPTSARARRQVDQAADERSEGPGDARVAGRLVALADGEGAPEERQPLGGPALRAEQGAEVVEREAELAVLRRREPLAEAGGAPVEADGRGGAAPISLERGLGPEEVRPLQPALAVRLLDEGARPLQRRARLVEVAGVGERARQVLDGRDHPRAVR